MDLESGWIGRASIRGIVKGCVRESPLKWWVSSIQSPVVLGCSSRFASPTRIPLRRYY